MEKQKNLTEMLNAAEAQFRETDKVYTGISKELIRAGHKREESILNLASIAMQAYNLASETEGSSDNKDAHYKARQLYEKAKVIMGESEAKRCGLPYL